MQAENQAKRKRTVLLGVEVGGNQALRMEGAELINITHIRGRTSPLNTSKRKLNIEGTANGMGQN